MSDALIAIEFAGHALAFTLREFDAARERAREIGLGGDAKVSSVEALVDSREMARIASVPVGKIEELGRQGRIPVVKVGPKYVRYSPSRVLAALCEDD